MKKEQEIIVRSAQADALSARILLEELRAGRLPNALELLEQQLDTNILILERLTKETDEPDRQSITEVLKVVRDYRARHPRKTEARI